MRRLIPLGFLLGVLMLGGCAKGEDAALDNAAPLTGGAGNAPPEVPGKKVNKMPPLTGPNAGKDGTGGI